MLPFHQLSYWEKDTFLNKIDYLIIGSGIVGLSTAIHLKKKHPRKKVLIVERGYLPSGASTKNAGFACIGSASELLDDLKNSSSEEVFRTVAKRWEGLHYLRSLLGDANIDYQELGSYELFQLNEKAEYDNCLNQLDYLNKELKSVTGISTVFKPSNDQIETSGFSGFGFSISNAAEGQIDTGKMLSNLVKLVHSFGVQILNSISVDAINTNSINTPYGKIDFDKLAICTNGLAKQFLDQEDIRPARAQVIVTSPISKLGVKGIYHFDKGYYYFRNIGNRVLFGGGRNLNFQAEETDELNTSDQIINHLCHILETQILPTSAFTVEQHWAGTMGVGAIKSPIVKQVDKNLFCGVRLGGMGVAIGSLVGKELAELMA